MPIPIPETFCLPMMVSWELLISGVLSCFPTNFSQITLNSCPVTWVMMKRPFESYTLN